MDRNEIVRALETGTELRAALDAARQLEGDGELLELSFRVATRHAPPWVDSALTRYWADTIRKRGMAPAFAARVVNVLEEDPVGRAPELLAATAVEARRFHHPTPVRRVMGAKWPRVLVVLGRLVGEVEERGWSRRIEDAFRNCLAWQRSWPLRDELASTLRGVLIRAMRSGICPSPLVPTPLDRDPVGTVKLLGEALRACVRRPDRRWQPFIRVAASLVMTAPATPGDEVAVALADEELRDEETFLLVEALLSVESWSEDPSLLWSPSAELALVTLYVEGRDAPGQVRLRDFLARMCPPSDPLLRAAEQSNDVGPVADEEYERQWYGQVEQLG
ncbi:MAG TPA: hypothetical protein QGF58_12635 [Myxococcota bacterium]|nr:hypothetical protein [Myxococcota bacterium]